MVNKSGLHDSLLLLSSGLDSSANLAMAFEREETPRLAITFNYGQRAATPEILHAEKLCEYYQVPEWRVMDVPWLGDLGGSALTDYKLNIPTIANAKLDDFATTTESAKAVWVPNRNGVFIQIAAAIAESLTLSKVVVGFNAEEAVTFPDNSPGFLLASNHALEFSTANHVKAICYTTTLNKKQIVEALRSLRKKPFPFHLVWPCYGDGPKRCGICESCRRFERAIGI